MFVFFLTFIYKFYLFSSYNLNVGFLFKPKISNNAKRGKNRYWVNLFHVKQYDENYKFLFDLIDLFVRCYLKYSAIGLDYNIIEIVFCSADKCASHKKTIFIK